MGVYSYAFCIILAGVWGMQNSDFSLIFNYDRLADLAPLYNSSVAGQNLNFHTLGSNLDLSFLKNLMPSNKALVTVISLIVGNILIKE